MYSENELLEWLQKLGDGPDSPPSQADLRNHDDSPSVPTYLNRFESWQDALLAAGFDSKAVAKRTQKYGKRPQQYSDEELIVQIKELADELGRTPRWDEFCQMAEASGSTVASRFGSWNNALERAGCEVTKPHDGSDKYSDDELLDHIRSVAQRIDGEPSVREMRKVDGVPAINTYQRRFGSWTDAKEAAFGDDRSQRRDRSEGVERVTPGLANPECPVCGKTALARVTGLPEFEVATNGAPTCRQSLDEFDGLGRAVWIHSSIR